MHLPIMLTRHDGLALNLKVLTVVFEPLYSIEMGAKWVKNRNIIFTCDIKNCLKNLVNLMKRPKNLQITLPSSTSLH